MSEYQYYEFLAIDQALSAEQREEIRGYSTRATITATSFVNEYHWGDFRGSVEKFMTKYFDVHVYFANWGSRHLWMRLPAGAIDAKVAEQYCMGDTAEFRLAGSHALLMFCSEDEGGDWEGDDDGWMASLAPLRAELLAGDLRCLYLGWLACVNDRQLDDDEIEPPVPAGLKELSGPLETFAQYMRIEKCLLEAAAQQSAARAADEPTPGELQTWIGALPAADKDSLLSRLAQEPPAVVQRELLQRFRKERRPAQAAAAEGPRRTVSQLLSDRDERVEQERRILAEKRAAAKAQAQRQAEAARQERLDALARRESVAWENVDALIKTKLPKKYDEAVSLLQDLRDLAAREGRSQEAAQRIQSLRATHSSKPSLMQRFDKVGL